MKWLIHLIDKYYTAREEMRLERIEKEAEQKRCKTCEFLEKELVLAHQREEKLLTLLHPTETRVQEDDEELKPINRSQYVPWHVKRQQLETQRRRDKDLATSKTTEELEKELGIDNAS